MKPKKYLIIILIILIISLLVLVKYNHKDEKRKSNNTSEQIKNVMDYSKFYMISNCVEKYINYIINKDSKNLMKIVNDSYLQEKNIDEKNILSLIDNIDKKYTFQARKMLYKKGDSDETYYVYGFLIEDGLDGISEKKDFYTLVKVNDSFTKFSIIPYDGEVFKK